MRRRLACACADVRDAGARVASTKAMSRVTLRAARKPDRTTSTVSAARAPNASVSAPPMPSRARMRLPMCPGGLELQRFAIDAALPFAPEAYRDLFEVHRGGLERGRRAQLSAGRFREMDVECLPIAERAGNAQVRHLESAAERVRIGAQVVPDVGFVPSEPQVVLDGGGAGRWHDLGRAP